MTDDLDDDLDDDLHDDLEDDLEQCDECGFDATEWNELDTRRTIGLAADLFRQWTARMSDEALGARPAEGVWSALEYADHTRETLFGLRVMCEVALEQPGTDLGPGIEPSDAGAPRHLAAEPVFAALHDEATTFARRLAELDDARWAADVVLGGQRRSVRWAGRHAVHDLWHHLVDIARNRATSGDVTPPATGSVAQLNRSGGGVPKLPVDAATIGRRGVAGDVQAARQHHGRPWQALCLWSADVIEMLQAEGHPIGPGSAGENLTLRGLDWSQLRAGTVLDIGEVRCQLSSAAVPCAKNARWFADGDVARILHTRHPDATRWYATVLRGGDIRPGDPARVVS